MNPKFVQVLLPLCLACSTTARSQANPPAPGASAAVSSVKFVTDKPSDRENFLGDRIDYESPLDVLAIRLGSDAAAPVCIPPASRLRGLGTAMVKDGNKEPARQTLFRVSRVEADEHKLCDGKTMVKLGQTVALDPALLREAPPDRYGWTYGTLFVPYKYQFRGDRSTSGSATLGGYLGYRSTILGTTTSLVMFAGPTKVDVPTVKDGKAETESLAGLSYGVGVLGTIKDGFKAGLVVGADRVSKSANYANNGKPWISLSLGYDFTN